MASASTKAAITKSILKPVTTLKGHREDIRSISYFPDGQRMISGSLDETTRQWDLKAGKEIEGARGVCEGRVYAVAVSRDGRWVVTGGRGKGELKACEIETGIVKTFEGHSRDIFCIDISADSTLLASASVGETARIWNLETGKLVPGPFKSSWVDSVRFSPDSKKLAVKLSLGTCLEVWDVRSRKLDRRIAAFEFSFILHPFDESAAESALDLENYTNTIYEFDAVTLKIVGAPFKGHTKHISGLALSFDDALLVTASYSDNTIKLWAFESRQLLASFDVQNLYFPLVLSPDSRQLVYTTSTKDDHKIYICNTPPDILAQARIIARKKLAHKDLLNSDATRPTRPPAGHRRPPISAIPIAPRLPPARDPQQPTFLRLNKFLRFSPRANAVPVRHIQPRDPLDVPATLPLPSPLSGQAATRFDHFETSSPSPPSDGIVQSLRQHLSFLVPRHSHGLPVVEVAPGRKTTRLVAVKLPEYKKVDDTRHPSSQQATIPQENDTSDIDSLPDVHWCKAFLCYYSCWSHGRLRMPPRWRLERVDIPRQDDTANGSRSGAHGRS
ncbi:hypothetical protein EV702DRAFT_1204148 [Suillus placidus]|uniref:WD40 repeat-like protein n=1 Tax=Suillus placidus TaxID=48579 RepID=A0A9P6ZHE7_9AGAM|nr:hypothetical protein EV702DRAFT_1204148 [Suillus placidus]